MERLQVRDDATMVIINMRETGCLAIIAMPVSSVVLVWRGNADRTFSKKRAVAAAVIILEEVPVGRARGPNKLTTPVHSRSREDIQHLYIKTNLHNLA
jgi:hypothetical protein